MNGWLTCIIQQGPEQGLRTTWCFWLRNAHADVARSVQFVLISSSSVGKQHGNF